MKKIYLDKVNDADLVLIGIGTEFEEKKFKFSENAIQALQELLSILQGKNYYVITTCMNSILKKAGFPADRIVSPCGNVEKKQCDAGCENSLAELSEEEKELYNEAIIKEELPFLGVCPVCGEKMVLNNVYAKQYDENGYLEDWKRYTKWLQGTLNKKLCVLELGVDMVFPSIIRWPFEKVAFYNQKAVFIRVNEKLYHMSEELKDKGIAVEKNAIDWLLDKDI